MDPLSSLASTLVVASPFVTFGYLGLCLIWPYRACRRCEGMGRFRGPFGGIRMCGPCAGSGLRLRFGRRVINTIHRIYRDLNDPRNR